MGTLTDTDHALLMSFVSNIALTLLFTLGMIAPPQLDVSKPAVQQCCFDPMLPLVEVKTIEPLKPLDIQPIAQLEPITHIPAHNNVVPGNDYAPGNCTWYVKSRRPDLPNNLWHAKYWYENAQAAGYEVSDMPLIGAVGVSFDGYYGHVVYVEALNGDGTIMISEMNYAGEYSQRTRAASASEFKYIY